MPITPKPKKSDTAIAALINRGLNVASEPLATAPADVTTTVRIPGRIAGPMKASVAARPVPITQNSWILEAIAEKLAREQGQ